jgi:hypothetical protein
MSIEPMDARKGLEEMAALLIAAHGFVAQLSAARLALQTGARSPDPAIRDWLEARLSGQSDTPEFAAAAPAGPLAAAALAVTTAARTYERAAKSAAD